MSQTLQAIIVFLVGAAAAVWIVLRIRRTVRGRRNPCAGCGRNCDGCQHGKS